MLWIIIAVLFCFLAIGTVQSKQDTQIQQMEELIQATYPPIEREARNAAKTRERSIAFMGKLVTWAVVLGLVWYTFFHTPAHAQPYPTYTTEQLCKAYNMDYFHRVCIGKNQYGLNMLRLHWDQVSAKTRKQCLDDQRSIERISPLTDPYHYQLTADAYWRLADCMYRWGVHEMMPTEVR